MATISKYQQFEVTIRGWSQIATMSTYILPFDSYPLLYDCVSNL